MLLIICVAVFMPFLVTAENCVYSTQCKNPVAPAATYIKYCPAVFSDSGTIKLDLVNVTVTPPIDYTGLQVFIIIYYAGLEQPLFALQRMYSCSEIKNAYPPVTSKLPCPGKKGDPLMIFDRQIDPVQFQPSPGMYTIHLELSNQDRKLMTCFEIKIKVVDAEDLAASEQKQEHTKIVLGGQGARNDGRKVYGNSDSDAKFQKPVDIKIVH